MSKEVDELLKAHQAIIDAWYDNWLKEQRARINEFWRRNRASKPEALSSP